MQAKFFNIRHVHQQAMLAKADKHLKDMYADPNEAIRKNPYLKSQHDAMKDLIAA